MKRETVWTFDTPNFRVALEIEPEEMDPADSFERQDDIDAVRNGDVEWFCAHVIVYAGSDPDDLTEIGRDVLGGCAYNTVREFYQSHREGTDDQRNTLATKARNVSICHYFPDMVATAIHDARHNMRRRAVLASGLRY